jgi:demethylmenaquinone methyltransferase/2-methoxy-6-polyprenyl-1,4-benzoquinol methylase
MANKFYQPGGERAARVQDLFSAVAPRYDLVNDLQSFGLHRLWKRRLLTLAKVRPGERVLDVCCGTGDVALRFRSKGAQVVGVDFSMAMLEVAHRRAGRASDAVTFVRADALHLPFPDAQFDVVTVSYGLRNLSSVEDGLREMWRVAKGGGRLLVLDFGKPSHQLLRECYFAYLRYWVPVFGRLFCGDPALYSYILESLHHYPGQEGIAALMRQFSGKNVRVHNLLGGMMSINYGEKGC